METDTASVIIEGAEQVTIRQYARYVLSHVKIKEALQKLDTYKIIADRMIDSLVGMRDTDEMPFKLENPFEEEAMTHMIKDMERVKEVALARIMDPLQKDLHASSSCFHGNSVNLSVDRFLHNRSIRSLEGVSLALFKLFTVSPEHIQYLVNDTIPHQIQTGHVFATKEEKLEAVFSLFLWCLCVSRESSYLFSPRTRETTFLALEVSLRQRFLFHCSHLIKLDGSGDVRLLFDDPVWGFIQIREEFSRHFLDQDTISLIQGRFVPEALQEVECRYCMERQLGCRLLKTPNEHFFICGPECYKLYTKK